MTRLRAALTALALTATVLLGGCAQTAATTAVVNGVVIKESTVDDMAQSLVSSGAVTTYGAARASAASKLIAGEVARQVAHQSGISLTQPDISSLSAGNPTYALFLTTPLGVQFATDYTDAVQVSSASADWSQQFLALPVQLNPRYGSWPAFVADLAATTSVAPPTGSMSAVSGS